MLPAGRLIEPSVPHDDVIDAVQRYWKSHQYGELALCLGLRRLFRDNVHRGAGFAAFKDYAEAAFEIPPKLSGLYSFLGSHLERLPLSLAAMERGELSYTKVREYAAIADEGNEAFWVDYARGHTNREVERRTARYRAEQDGEEFSEKVKVTSELTPREAQATRKAREMFLKATGEPVPEPKLLPKLARMFVEGGMWEERTGKPEKPRPYLAIHFCPSCLTSWVPVPGMNLRVKTRDWLTELRNGAEVFNFLPDLLCDCKEVKHRRDRCPQWKVPEGEPALDRYRPAALRRYIEARDGNRCRVPGCSNPLPLEDGHLGVPFREGAPMAPPFLGQMCAAHNRMIETGALRVEGYAPFERYYLADGTFLGRGNDPTPRVSGDPHVGRRGKRGTSDPPGANGGADRHR